MTTSLVPNDPRVTRRTAQIAGFAYSYLYSAPEPATAVRGTILLLHGFPDLALAWRHLIPYLQSRNLRVIAPDLLGYGRTSVPTDVSQYTMRNMSAHMRELVRQVCPGGDDERVIVAGHDWGAGFAWRIALWEPSMVQAIVCFAVPFWPPTADASHSLLETRTTRLPSLRYQLQFASGETERILSAQPGRVRKALAVIYGADTAVKGMTVDTGLHEDVLDQAKPLGGEVAGLLGDPAVADYYAGEFERSGMSGPLAWYKTTEPNWTDEKKELIDGGRWSGKFGAELKAFMVMGEHDTPLPVSLMEDMEKNWEDEKAVRKEVIEGASHWMLWDHPQEVEKLVGEFLDDILGNGSKL